MTLLAIVGRCLAETTPFSVSETPLQLSLDLAFIRDITDPLSVALKGVSGESVAWGHLWCVLLASFHRCLKGPLWMSNTSYGGRMWLSSWSWSMGLRKWVKSESGEIMYNIRYCIWGVGFSLAWVGLRWLKLLQNGNNFYGWVYLYVDHQSEPPILGSLMLAWLYNTRILSSHLISTTQ